MSLQGIDVSIWQGAFPWNDAAIQGIVLGIAKSSEGRGYTDPQWARNVAELLKPGPIVGGSYHFLRPDLGNDPVEEAKWYLSRHPAQCFNSATPWIFSLDAESAGGNSVGCNAFMDYVSSQIGYSCWFYSYSNWISTRVIQASNRPLWLAWPRSNGAMPTLGWPVVTMQQYGTRQFSVGAVDANEFFGEMPTLLKLAGSASPEDDLTPDQAQKLNEIWMSVTASDAAKDDAGNPEPDHWATGNILGHVRAIERKIEGLQVPGGSIQPVLDAISSLERELAQITFKRG